MNGKIYIPEPCHENWDKMLPAEKGRHCEVCSKVVTDFSMMNKAQIITTLENSKGEVCGHIPMDKLSPSNPKQKIYFWLKGSFLPKLSYTVFGILGLATLFKKSAYGQNLGGKVVMVNGGSKYQAPTLDSLRVNVVVVDEQNQPVPGALVTIKVNDRAIASEKTSRNGECSNLIEIESSGYTLINIEVDATGYKHKEIKQIRVAKDNQTYRVKLNEEVIVVGKMKMDETSYHKETINPEVTTEKCVTKDPGIAIDPLAVVLINPSLESIVIKQTDMDFPQRITTDQALSPHFEFTNNNLSFIAFPNPTISDVTIQTKEDITFDVNIYNESGVLILQQANQYQRTSFSLQGNAAGNYFAVIFFNNKAIETHKITLIK